MKSANITADWKVATVFTGGNDLCAICSSSGDPGAAYLASLQSGLDLLLANVPRLLVNLVSEVDVSLLAALHNRSGHSCATHLLECPCLAAGSAGLTRMHEAALAYQQTMHTLAAMPKYQRDDWALVVQPMYEGFIFPRTPDGAPDGSYFSPDCFHYSTKARRASSRGVTCVHVGRSPHTPLRSWSKAKGTREGPAPGFAGGKPTVSVSHLLAGPCLRRRRPVEQHARARRAQAHLERRLRTTRQLPNQTAPVLCDRQELRIRRASCHFV